MTGKIYGVGVGPGDPELITVKAVRIINGCDIIAVAGKTPESSLAYSIAQKAVPHLDKKRVIAIEMPMTRDRELLMKSHLTGALRLKELLDAGEDVAFLTLGDPSIYSSFSYLMHILEDDGYHVAMVSGVPSFCAAAARLGIPLVLGNESLHILPAGTYPENSENACRVYMKSARSIREMKSDAGYVGIISDCGLESEKIYDAPSDVPEDASYFTLMIEKTV